jgi:predicted RNA binding protein YcfA (HicA-like mRNA interferase family)
LTQAVGVQRRKFGNAGEMPKKYLDVRRVLLANGWNLIRQRGSHQVWRSPDGSRTVIVSEKNSDTIPAGTLAGIRKSTGLDHLR